MDSEQIQAGEQATVGNTLSNGPTDSELHFTLVKNNTKAMLADKVINAKRALNRMDYKVNKLHKECGDAHRTIAVEGAKYRDIERALEIARKDVKSREVDLNHMSDLVSLERDKVRQVEAENRWLRSLVERKLLGDGEK